MTGRWLDRGQVTIFVVIMTTAIIMVAGLVLDGGRILSSARLAANLADSAARAGAQQVDEASVRSGTIVLDEDEARSEAERFVLDAGYETPVVNVTADEITVTVSIDQPLLILPLATRTISATGTARIQEGI